MKTYSGMNPETFPEILQFARSSESPRAKEALDLTAHQAPNTEVLGNRIKKFLDIVVRLVVFKPKQVAAATATIINPDPKLPNSLETKVYLAYNHPLESQEFKAVEAHLQELFQLLKSIQVFSSSNDSSPSSGQLSPNNAEIVLEMEKKIHVFARECYIAIIHKRLAMLDSTLLAFKMNKKASLPVFTAEEATQLDDVFHVLSAIGNVTNDFHKDYCLIPDHYGIWESKGYLAPPTQDKQLILSLDAR
ncbi:hypothetical protein C8J56DRAFT_1055307 [Mycena floridula]|nr:hypothetical protein C8J56DRAFT_1055307 [Mycena floridula]